MKSLKAWHVGVAGSFIIAILAVFVLRGAKKVSRVTLAVSVGDLQAQHAPVKVGPRDVNGRTRLVDGDEVSTGADGRARVRLDDGLVVVVDANSQFRLKPWRLELLRGRIFTQGPASARTQIEFAGAATEVAGSAAAFELDSRGAAKVYCAQGELMLRAGSRQVRVESGETATLSAEGPRVSPEKAFDDWTGGLAVPWANHAGQRAFVPELRSPDESGVGAPLSVREQRVDVSVDGEFAVTRTRTTYFNGTENSIIPQVRVALPASAILTRVARRLRGEEAEAQIAIQRPDPNSTGYDSTTPRLEWSGNGWLRGVLPHVESGGTIELALTYAEWLPTHAGRRSYRFPLADSGEPPLIGELHAEIRAVSGETRFLSTNAGAELRSRRVALTRSDFRPTSDLVVELAGQRSDRRAARAYVSEASPEDPYVLFRTEVPERTEAGISLAVVLDTSLSVSAGVLETERAVVEALLQGLGPRDEVVVLAADQSVRPLGADLPQAVTPALRSELSRALSSLRPGGASNLGVALERGADLLDAEARGKRAGSGVLIYIGDGRPTMGEADAAALRRRLSQRSGGMPRFASVAVGSGADRVALAQLTNGVGTSYEVIDRADAARVGADLLADAVEPSLRDVEFDLGPNVDRIYPRDSRSVVAGSTLSVIGRLRGSLPKHIDLIFRDGRERVRERRSVDAMALPHGADLAQRWAAARIEEITARGDGLEPAIALAVSARLLTPWTGWFFDAASGARSTSFARRLIDFSPRLDAPFARYLDRQPLQGATLLEPASLRPGVSLGEAAAVAVRRILKQAAQSVRACRDARAAVRPDVAQSFVIDLALAEDGRVTRLHVEASEIARRDAVLERCVEGVVRALPYFAAGVLVNIKETLKVPPLRAAKRSVCSPASRLSLPIRRAVWRERGVPSVESFARAQQACELATFADKREYLLLILEANPVGSQRLNLANSFDELGETDAATFLRKEALRRVRSFAELEELTRMIQADEPDVDAEFEKAYAAAPTDEKRLEVVRKFLRIAPHASIIRRRLFALLEALGRKEELVSAIDAVRNEPIVDAGLLAHGASALRRVGLDIEGRRAFGELLERAPSDPWTLAFVGDRLRAERLFDEAAEAYESLRRLLPGDGSVGLRLGLAHAGAGRLDVATRLLEGVTRTGGRDDDGRLGELASITSAVLIAQAREQTPSAAEEAELVRRLAETPLPDVASVIWIQNNLSDDAVQIRVAREHTERELRAPEFDAPALGLSAIRVERGDGSARLVFSRSPNSAASRPIHAEIAALVLSGEQGGVKLVRRNIELGRDAKTLELRWNGEAFL
ncbi:MAG: VWA domain-containing protein [Myxococcota bacterium]